MATASAAFRDVVARYEPVIGLEVHCQLLTRTKLFCSCRNRFGDQPNTNVCPVCLGLPGALPVLSREAVTLAMRAALATHCTVQETSIFARKNYFYPDLPKGYQISQYERPLATEGYVEIPSGGAFRRVRVQRIHMEEDAGKLLHEGFPWSGEKSGVDFNRSGIPLIEIVSHPDLRSSEEAHDYLTALKAVLLYAEVSDCNMEEGSLRCDANVSVRPRGTEAFGTRAEIKNLNSFRNVARAIDHEIARQVAMIESGRKVVQETRLWNADKAETASMRSKEEAHDYRYFPEPDLPPLVITREWIEEVRRSLPELPAGKRRRFVAEYGIPDYDAGVLTLSREVAEGGRAAPRRLPGEAGAARGAREAHRRRDHHRQDRQGRLREDVGERGGAEGYRGPRGAHPGFGRRADPGGDRRGDGGKPRAGGHLPERQDQHPGLVRRAGHEEDRGTSQPPGGERAAQEGAGRAGLKNRLLRTFCFARRRRQYRGPDSGPVLIQGRCT